MYCHWLAYASKKVSGIFYEKDTWLVLDHDGCHSADCSGASGWI